MTASPKVSKRLQAYSTVSLDELSEVEVDLNHLYAVLRSWATNKGQQTYSELSKQYEARTGMRFTPHGTWDRPLGDVNTAVEHHRCSGAFGACCPRRDRPARQWLLGLRFERAAPPSAR